MTRPENRVACHVCRKEIPEAAALHAEAQGYILNFCEPGGLASWWEALEHTRRVLTSVDSKKEEKR